MSSPDVSHIIMCSSSVTFRQFQPSEANSIEFRAALAYNSVGDDQSRSFARSEYSVLNGMGRTDTEWFSDTLRFFLLLLVPSFPFALCLLKHAGGGVIVVMKEEE